MAAASTRCRCPLCGTSAPMLPMRGAWVGSQNAACTLAGSRCAMRSASMPSCTVTICAGGIPSARRMRAIASDAVMNVRTWRYFHCENEFFLRWKSTRRDATSGGTGCAVDIDRASAAVETACGSCAWTMSGRSRLRSRDSFQPAFRSSSWLGASGTKSSPSAARRRSSPAGCAISMARCPAERRPITVSSTWFWPPRQVVAVSM